MMMVSFVPVIAVLMICKYENVYKTDIIRTMRGTNNRRAWMESISVLFVGKETKFLFFFLLVVILT